MDNKPVSSFLKHVDENARQIHSSSPEDNEGNRSFGHNFVPVKIKEEEITDEIQEYAATTMSELLGWYGYDKVDSGCTRSLNLDHFTSTSDVRSSTMFKMDQNFITKKQASKSPISLNENNSPFDTSSSSLPYSINSTSTINSQSTSPPLSMKKVSPDSTSRFPYENYPNSICSDSTFCSWCGRVTKTCKSDRGNPLSHNMVHTMGHFCSEACFAAGRREVFKRAKTCDWCRHIRNPVSYVDFQDGESELQFCSDKCLNQYKMNIFCHETQTHLMLHGLNNVSCHEAEEGNLITPELWFRSCQSPLNSSTEDTYIGNEHVTPNMLTSSHDREEEKEQTETERPVESNRKAVRKRNSFCIRICTKANDRNEKNKNFRTEINKNDVEDIKEPILTIQENEFCQFINNQNDCEVRCAEETVPNSKNFKKDHRSMDIIDHDPYDRQQRDNTFLEKNIYVKNIKDLQEVRERDPPENVLRSSTWFSNSTASATQCESPFVVKSFGDESNRTKYKKQTNASLRGFSPVRSNQAESSVSSSITLLPPVTILVPYPIPVPIPIPIPIPIPSPILSKAMAGEQEVSLTVKDTKCENLKYNDSIKNKCSVSHESQLCINANVSTMESSQHSTSAKLSLTLSPPSNKNVNNDNAHSLKHNTKFSKKRKRSNETINSEHEDLQLKKRNKFVTA